MHEIPHRIAQWRQELAIAGCGPEVIDELESHLREEMHRLILAGESENQAMDSALQKLGSPAVLATEFAKVAPAATWLPIRVAYGMLVTLTLITLVVVLVVGRNRAVNSVTLLLGFHVLSITLAYWTTLASGSLGICYMLDRLFRGLTPGQSRSLSSTTFRLSTSASLLTALGIALAAIWSKLQLGHYWGWDIREIGACLVLCLALVQAFLAWRRPDAIHALMQMAILGNIAVAGTWFGYNALQSMQPTNLFILAFFFAIQIAAFAISLTPARILSRQPV